MANNDWEVSISCAKCKKTNDDFLILPCFNTICSSHIYLNNIFECNSCGQEHQQPENGFPRNIPNLKIFNLNNKTYLIPKNNIKFNLHEGRVRLVWIINKPIFFFFSDKNDKIEIEILKEYLDEETRKEFEKTKTSNFEVSYKKLFEVIKSAPNINDRLVQSSVSLNQETANNDILEKPGHISQIDDDSFESLNENSDFKKFEKDSSFKFFPMMTVLTGKYGRGKTSILNKLILYSNRTVNTVVRKSLISLISCDEITSRDKFSSEEKSEISHYQNKTRDTPEHYFHLNKADKNDRMKYLVAKKKSIFTYSSLYMMLNYILNKGYYEPSFMLVINNYLKENDFLYNIHIINKRLIFNNPNEHCPWIEIKELSEG